MVATGDILSHNAYYLDGSVFKKKYLLVLAVQDNGDIIYRLLTSRQAGRPRMPPCYHGFPYPGFYLGVIGGTLDKESWIDLRECEDLDKLEYSKLQREGIISRAGSLPISQLPAIIECCAFAEDTTRRQQSVLLSVKQNLIQARS